MAMRGVLDVGASSCEVALRYFAALYTTWMLDLRGRAVVNSEIAIVDRWGFLKGFVGEQVAIRGIVDHVLAQHTTLVCLLSTSVISEGLAPCSSMSYV